MEKEEEALGRVAAHPDVQGALAFLTTWPDLRRAGALVRARLDAIDGNCWWTLTPAAERLENKEPLAASLLYRRMIDFTLDHRRSQRYGHTSTICCRAQGSRPSSPTGRDTNRMPSTQRACASDIRGSPASGRVSMSRRKSSRTRKRPGRWHSATRPAPDAPTEQEKRRLAAAALRPPGWPVCRRSIPIAVMAVISAWVGFGGQTGYGSTALYWRC
jgi:hypothetical protein